MQAEVPHVHMCLMWAGTETGIADVGQHVVTELICRIHQMLRSYSTKYIAQERTWEMCHVQHVLMQHRSGDMAGYWRQLNCKL